MKEEKTAKNAKANPQRMDRELERIAFTNEFKYLHLSLRSLRTILA